MFHSPVIYLPGAVNPLAPSIAMSLVQLLDGSNLISVWELLAGFCEHGSEQKDSIKGAQIIDF